jgi:DNA-binding GntR family transcriptional regulator
VPERPSLRATVGAEPTPSIVARALREAIADGTLAAGTRLGEVRLAGELGVSRGPLREAMQRLTQEGLLVSVRNRGIFVAELSDEQVRDVYVARAAVERAAAGEILRRDPADAAERLRPVLATMAQASGAGDGTSAGDDGDGDDDAVGRADLAFHQLLVELSGSPRLVRMHSTLLTETRMCLRALRRTYRRPDARVAEHRAIVDALEAGDVAGVDRLLVEHMDDALERLVTADDVQRVTG